MENGVRVALIPAYEPSETLAGLTEQLSDAGFQVVLVNDGSGIKYNRIFEEAGRYAVLLNHGINKGKGCALKTGLSYIRGHFPENSVIVTFDADGQHSVEDAVRVCGRASLEKGTLVLGCRGFDKGVPVRGFFGNKVTRFIYCLFTGRHVSSTQTGLRAFGAELIPFMLEISGDRYEYEMNVLLECSKQGIPTAEVKIKTIYFDNNADSHFDAVKDSFRVYREIIKFAASSLTGFLVDYGMYSLLVVLTGGLGTAASVSVSNIAARIVSASVNYTINRKLVFKSHANIVRTGAQYFALAACILAGNTLFLNWLVEGAGINKFAAKILTEATFFILSWLAQKFIIFKHADGRKAARGDGRPGPL